MSTLAPVISVQQPVLGTNLTKEPLILQQLTGPLQALVDSLYVHGLLLAEPPPPAALVEPPAPPLPAESPELSEEHASIAAPKPNINDSTRTLASFNVRLCEGGM